MKYPCENCLVNSMCKEACDMFIFFTDSLVGGMGKYVPTEWIDSKIKMVRFLTCRNFYPTSKVFNKLSVAFTEFHGVHFWNVDWARI